MRLQITLSGTFHAVALLHLTRPAIKRLQDDQPENWRSHLGLMTVGPHRKTLLSAFLQAGGYTPSVNLYRRGMLLQAKHFGIEIVADDLEQIPDQLDSRPHETELLPLLRGFGPDDLLGVFQMQADAAMSMTWKDAPTFDSSLVQLHLDNLAPVLNVRQRFDVIHEVSFAGASPSDRKLQSLGPSRMLKPIFHVANAG